MGYTHYYARTKQRSVNGVTKPNRLTLPKAVFAALAQDVRQIIEASGVPIGDGRGETPAFECTNEAIVFNGLGEEDSHETFYLERKATPQRWENAPEDPNIQFLFTKTARKPYDVVVTATLCALEDRLPGYFDIGSDGNTPDWKEGYALAVTTLQRELRLPPFLHSENAIEAEALEEAVLAPFRAKAVAAGLTEELSQTSPKPRKKPRI